MEVFTNNVPDDCDYLTNGKHYEFESDDPNDEYGFIVDDTGERIYVVTQNAEYNCSYLNEKASWEFVNE